MKQIAKTLMVAFVAIMTLSLTTAYAGPKDKCIKKLERLTKEVKRDCANYEEEDWDAVLEQYDLITKEMKEYEYDEEELRHIGTLKGRFFGCVARKYIAKGSKRLGEFLQEMGGFFKGLLEQAIPDDE